jgi:general secretion pathway protein F
LRKYKIVYQENGKRKTTVIETHDIKNESFPFTVIGQKEISFKPIKLMQKRVKSSEVLALFNELDIMLQANILLNDAIEILYDNTKNSKLKEILFTMIHTLRNGKKLNEELKQYESTLGILPLVFLKIAQENGNLKTVIHSLVMVLQSKQYSKEILISTLRYPIILSFSLFFLTLFTFYFIVPKFEHLFLQYDSNLPLATQWLLNFKYYLHHYFFYSFSLIVVCIIFGVAKYKNSQKFKYKMDKFLVLKIPIISKVIFNANFQLFFLSVTILLNDKYKFQTAFLNSDVLIRNCYLKAKLNEINQQIQSGKPISFAFENSNLFDDLILRLISVGEQSNSLNITINEVEKIYKKRLENSFKSFATYIEPIFFILISSFIVWLMLAIFMPIWNLSDAMSM